MRSRRVSVGRGGGSGRILIAIVVALFAIASYYFGTSRVENPVTGEVQRVNMSPQDEIMMGLQAASEIAQQFGGLHPDQEAQALVDRIGQDIVAKSAAADTDYEYEFHLLTHVTQSLLGTPASLPAAARDGGAPGA